MRQKPVHVRRRYAFGVSFGITSVIFLGWMASYGISSSPVLADKTNGDKIDTPVSSLTASAIGAFKDMKGMVFGSNKTEYSSIEVTGGGR